MNDTMLLGRIRTMDPDRPEAEAIAFEKGKITFVGTRKDAEKIPAAKKIELGEKTVLPGFIDTHVHVIPAGIFMNGCDLSKVRTISDVLRALADHARTLPKKEWALGAFFQDKLIEEKRFPTRKELDSISGEHPLLICHNDLHPIALNTKALEILRVKPGKNGVGVDENGELTGIIEDPACIDMLADILAKLGIGNILNGILRVDDYAAAHGVTTVFGKDVIDILLLRKLFKRLFRVEFVPMWYSDGCRDLKSLEKFIKGGKYPDACVCAFADGAFDGHSAAVAEPYTDRPDTCGILNYTDEEMTAFTEMAFSAGYQVSFHAIGDAAIWQVLRVYEKVLQKHPKKDHRLRIEHFEEPTKECIEKAAELGVALSMQPLLIEVCERMDFSGYEPFIGPERTRRCSPYRSILDKGILVGGGTDYPVTPMDVLHGVDILMNHPVPEERITLEEGLALNTREAAKLGFLEDRKGLLRPGMDADLVILSHDPHESLADITVEKTFRGGKLIFDRKTAKPFRKKSLAAHLLALLTK